MSAVKLIFEDDSIRRFSIPETPTIELLKTFVRQLYADAANITFQLRDAGRYLDTDAQLQDVVGDKVVSIVVKFNEEFPKKSSAKPEAKPEAQKGKEEDHPRPKPASDVRPVSSPNKPSADFSHTFSSAAASDGGLASLVGAAGALAQLLPALLASNENANAGAVLVPLVKALPRDQLHSFLLAALEVPDVQRALASSLVELVHSEKTPGLPDAGEPLQAHIQDQCDAEVEALEAKAAADAAEARRVAAEAQTRLAREKAQQVEEAKAAEDRAKAEAEAAKEAEEEEMRRAEVEAAKELQAEKDARNIQVEAEKQAAHEADVAAAKAEAEAEAEAARLEAAREAEARSTAEAEARQAEERATHEAMILAKAEEVAKLARIRAAEEAQEKEAAQEKAAKEAAEAAEAKAAKEPVEPEPVDERLLQLESMGFTDRARNVKLLVKHKGSLEMIIAELLQ